MKMKTVCLLGFCLFALQANAEQSVVIDSQSVGEPAAPSGNGASTGAAPADANVETNAANKEQFLKGGKMSPRERAAVAKAEIGNANIQIGADFLASNKAKPGVVSLPSGVQYKVLRAGKGNMPTEESVIRCRYKGTLIDGTTIDKSDTKKPASLNVKGLLAGLKEAVKLMPTGSKWEIVIPPQLAYGAIGNRGVGPNAVLVYEMEILGIK
jgi:FKBP-type peptidyl-prolyl cis-trans isomerase FklB